MLGACCAPPPPPPPPPLPPPPPRGLCGGDRIDAPLGSAAGASRQCHVRGVLTLRDRCLLEPLVPALAQLYALDRRVIACSMPRRRQGTVYATGVAHERTRRTAQHAVHALVDAKVETDRAASEQREDLSTTHVKSRLLLACINRKTLQVPAPPSSSSSSSKRAPSSLMPSSVVSLHRSPRSAHRPRGVAAIVRKSTRRPGRRRRGRCVRRDAETMLACRQPCRRRSRTRATSGWTTPTTRGRRRAGTRRRRLRGGRAAQRPAPRRRRRAGRASTGPLRRTRRPPRRRRRARPARWV